MSLNTLQDYLYTAINNGARWKEADDIPEALHGEIINAWRADADALELSEAYLGGSDGDLKTLLDFSLDEVLTHNAQKAMLDCFWLGMSWRVDEAIEKACEDLRSERPAGWHFDAERWIEEMRAAS